MSKPSPPSKHRNNNWNLGFILCCAFSLYSIQNYAKYDLFLVTKMTDMTMTNAINVTSGIVFSASASKSIPIGKKNIETVVDDKPLVNEHETKATPDDDENSSSSGDTFSAFCLLIKDDNDILSEWIAYHYHVFQMRRLIVAVDPTSETSPQPILDRWRDNFELDYTLWKDEDYAPDYFVERDYTKIPNSDGGIVIDISKNSTTTSTQQTKNANYIADYLTHPIVKSRFHPKNEKFVTTHQTQMRDDLIQINLHRFRQTNFVSECYRAIKSELSTTNNLSPWVVHIDTDEFLVPNPWMAHQLYDNEQNNLLYYHNKNFQTDKGTTIGNHNPYPNRDFLESILPQQPSEGSLWKLYQQFTTSQHWKESHGSFHTQEQMGCVMMPRINFGSHEDNDQHVTIATTAANDETLQTIMTTVTWNHNRFESLRWKYHTDFLSSKLPPKAIVDVDRLSWNDPVFVNQRIENLHHPLGEEGCTPLEMDFITPYQPLEPLAVYHYMGSLKRYMTRESPLRTKRKYKFKNDGANYATGDQNIPVKDNNKNKRKKNKHDQLVRNNNESRWWMKGWLDSFVDTHGAAKVYTVLGKEYASKS